MIAELMGACVQPIRVVYAQVNGVRGRSKSSSARAISVRMRNVRVIIKYN